MRLLANDIARCHGAKWGNEKTGEVLNPCKACKRRLQIALDRPTERVVYFAPPLFEQGVCLSRIGE